MACSIKINDEKYSELLGQMQDPTLALRLYLQEESDNAISSNKENKEKSLPAEKRVENLLKSRLKKIDEKLKSKDGNKFLLTEEKTKVNSILKRLKDEIKEGNKSYFYQTALSYMDEIEMALNSDSLTEDQLKSYFRDTKLFSDFGANISGELENTPLDEIVSLRAKKIALKLEPMIMRAVLEYTRKRGFDLDEDDLRFLENTGKAAAFTLDLSNDVNLFMQYVNKVTKEAGALRDFKLQEELKQIEELEKGLGKTNADRIKKKQEIFKKTASGKVLRNKLLTRQSDAFFKKYYELKSEVDRLKKKEDWVGYKTKRTEFLNWMKNNTVFINPSYFTGDDTHKMNVFNELVKQVGSEEYAQELIDSAENKRKMFTKEFNDYKDFINGMDDKTQEQKDELIRARNVQFNPEIYYEVLYATDKQKVADKYNIKLGDYFSEQFLIFAPKASKPEWFSNEFKAMQEDKALRDYYDYIKKTMNKYKNYLPEYATEKAHRQDYMFRAKAGLVEIFQNSGMKGVIPKMTSKIVDSFTTQFEHDHVSEIDSEGKEVGSIPISKLISIDAEIEKLEKKLSLLDKSKLENKAEIDFINNRIEELETQYSIDPSRSLEVFLAMALNYKFMSDIDTEMQLASEIVNAAKSKEVNGTFGDAKNTKERFENHIKVVLYGDSKEVEGQYESRKDFKDNVFEAKDLIGMSSDKKIRAKKLAKQIEDGRDEVEALLEKQDNGVKLTKDENAIVKANSDLIVEYRSLGGKRWTLSSALDSVINFQSLKTFGFNPISGISNLLFGLTTITTEGSAETYFNNSEVRSAFRIMLDSTKKYMSLGAIKTGHSDKITKLANKFVIEGDTLDVKSEKRHAGKSALDKINPYGFMQQSDFFMKMLGSIATMKNTKKWTIETKEGVKMSIWDSFDDKGNWKTELFDDKTNFDWNGDPLENGSLKLAEYTNYLKQINTKMHGNFSRENPVIMKRYIAGRLVSQFRGSWMPLYFEERFSDRKYDALLDETKEGRYKTLARLITDNEDLGKTMIQRAVKLLLKSSQEGLEDFEVANLRKTKSDIIFYTMLMIVMSLLKGIYDDDEDGKVDKNHKVVKMLLNQLHTLKGDIGFAVDINTFQSLTQKVVPSLAVLTDFQKAFSKTTAYLFDDRDTAKQDEKAFEGMWKYIFKAFPFTRQVINMETRSEKLFEDIQKQ
jgi:hypothetical protein